MAFIYCHNCDWTQDDFWVDTDEGHNPIRSVSYWREQLFSDKIDLPFTNDAMFIKQNGNITLREVIAREFEREASNIRGMRYRSFEEFKKLNPDRKCPKCGKKDLGID